ncbi:ABC transporter substrate-binding protein [Labrenzia sp. CE80]|uniref:ABC transporter substrate-binding protein n=1 Tax=Labrenzia sp. CE80 TaxID=1788986 RepID=UPI00129A2FA1|nr:ABC transporter substrate-binding protein [Labrenzia sp. CE80]
MKKQIFGTVLPLLFAAGAATMATAQDRVNYQLDWLPGGDKSPIYVCIEEGFCADAGIEINIVPGRGSTEAITKIATGTSDIGSADIGALMAAAASEDVPATAIMSIFNTGPHAFYTLAGNGIESFTDIEGKSVATSPFTSSNVYLPLVLSDNGLSEDAIELTKADPGALGPLLMTGRTDAIIAWLTNVSIFEAQAAEAGKELIILPWSDAGLELYSAALIANDTFLAERPDVARRFVAAFTQSLEFANENPAAAGTAVAAIVPELDAAMVEAAWMDSSVLAFNEITESFPLGSFDADRVAKTWARVAAAQGLDPAAFDPETVIDRSFATTE